MGRINTLDSVVAARIAAGEVIDRPQSVARELLDNAIDAGAMDITLSVRNGGMGFLSVSDNGEGIQEEDLPLTVKRHATSKIHSVDDLYHLSSLGFRGEALYSVSAVSRLTIASSYMGAPAWTYTVDNGIEEGLVKGGPDQGTTVTVEDLFKEIPARRSFLKREASEAQLCRSILLQKAMAFPKIHFRYIQEGTIKVDLPARATRYDRVLDILTLDEKVARGDFCVLDDRGEQFSVYLVTSLPGLHRSDRSRIRIYVNGRPVDEYSMVQAICYGYAEKLPGGAFPYSVLFIEDNPELVDFNIHPAKREVKLRNRAEIHHAVSSLVSAKLPTVIPTIKADEQPDLEPVSSVRTTFEDKSFLFNRYTPPAEKSAEDRHDTEAVSERRASYNTEQRPRDNSWLEKAKALSERREQPASYTRSQEKKEDVWTPEQVKSFTYIGQAFRLFLIVEMDGRLYLVDQHAAHERVLFDELRSQRNVQKLLVPIEFEVDGDIDAFLMEKAEVYTQFGIMIARKEEKLWELTSLPAMARPVERQLVDFIRTKMGSEDELESELYAIVACKAAIKAGDLIDRYSAEALLEKVFALEDPACPHGRTFIITMEEAELRKMVGRTK